MNLEFLGLDSDLVVEGDEGVVEEGVFLGQLGGGWLRS